VTTITRATALQAQDVDRRPKAHNLICRRYHPALRHRRSGLTCGARRNAGRQAKACRRLSCRRESGALSNAARAAYLTCHLLLMATLDEPMPWWGWLAALFVVLALTGCAQGITGQAGAPPGDVVTPRTKRRQKARQIRGTRCSARLGLWAQVNVVLAPTKRSMVVDTELGYAVWKRKGFLAEFTCTMNAAALFIDGKLDRLLANHYR
jgi:hypothetical protein